MSLTFNEKLQTYNRKEFKKVGNWKKIRALVNYSKAISNVDIWEELEFAIRSFLKGFLWESQEMLLDEILAHYRIDYTQWWEEGAWKRMQLKNGVKRGIRGNQYEIWFEELEQKRIQDRSKRPLYSKLDAYKTLYQEKSAC